MLVTVEFYNFHYDIYYFLNTFCVNKLIAYFFHDVDHKVKQKNGLFGNL